MAARKTERLLNLIFLLLASTKYLTKAQIRDAIADYREAVSDQAFDRMFERDKEELRELGITVEMGSYDSFFSDNEGYRIPRDAAELNDIELTPEEAAVVGLATRVWQHAGLSTGSNTALMKLKSIGVDVDMSALRMAEPRLSTAEPAFDAVWDATIRRVPITFEYARPGQDATERHLEPWGILSWRDRWYVIGHDRDRNDTRVFRVSRIRGEVVAGRSGEYDIPEGINLREAAGTLFPTPREEPAVLRVKNGRGMSLRRMADSVTAIDDTTDRVCLKFGSAWELAGEIASFGADVIVESPPELRDAVVSQLRRAASGKLDEVAS